MVDSSGKIHLNLARLKKAGHNFEIDVDSDKAIEFKGGANISIRDVLKVEKVFQNSWSRQQSILTDKDIEVVNFTKKD